MEAANSRGDHDAMRRCKRRMPGLRGKGQFGAPTRGADGKRFANMDEVLQWWHSHMTDHWQAPDTEDARPELEEIVRSVRERPVNLSDGRLDRVLRRMKLNKATSADEIPTELYEAVLEARADLYGIVRRCGQRSSGRARSVGENSGAVFAASQRGQGRGGRWAQSASDGANRSNCDGR